MYTQKIMHKYSFYISISIKIGAIQIKILACSQYFSKYIYSSMYVIYKIIIPVRGKD